MSEMNGANGVNGMSGIIKVKSASYARYEELLLKRDNIRKQAFQYQREYTAEFGDLIIAVFEKKIECIRKKKTIEYCQRDINHGRTVDELKLQEYLRKEMAEFQKQLCSLTDDVANARRRGEVSEMEALQIKKIYRRLAKQIDPDMNPAVADSEELQDLWQRVVVAYACNQLKELEELEVLVNKALERIGFDKLDKEIPNIASKIVDLENEIERIMRTDPYTYKHLLDDPDAVEEKRNSLKEELKSYEEYSFQLEEILQNLLGNGACGKGKGKIC